MLSDPKWILKPIACNADGVVDQNEYKEEEERKHKHCPMNDCLKMWSIIAFEIWTIKRNESSMRSILNVNVVFTQDLVSTAKCKDITHNEDVMVTVPNSQTPTSESAYVPIVMKKITRDW